jgi:uncharacterized protein (TIGR01777 family)
MNHIVLAGATGFLGNQLKEFLMLHGYKVVSLVRHGSQTEDAYCWDGKNPGDWYESIEGAFAVINLAGAPIRMRWTKDNKKVIYDSRIDSTRAIGKAIELAKIPPKIWINANGVGIYGDVDSTLLSEESPIGNEKNDFIVKVCKDWQEAVDQTNTPQTRKVTLRTGIVFGKGAPSFVLLAKITRAFLGSAVGTGKQYISWIHLLDYLRIIEWLLKHDISGPVNATAPNPVTNSELMHVLRTKLRRPWVPQVPSFLIKLISPVLSVDASLLLSGQRVFPKKMVDQGFNFEYDFLENALDELLVEG